MNREAAALLRTLVSFYVSASIPRLLPSPPPPVSLSLPHEMRAEEARDRHEDRGVEATRS